MYYFVNLEFKKISTNVSVVARNFWVKASGLTTKKARNATLWNAQIEGQIQRDYSKKKIIKSQVQVKKMKKEKPWLIGAWIDNKYLKALMMTPAIPPSTWMSFLSKIDLKQSIYCINKISTQTIEYSGSKEYEF